MLQGGILPLAKPSQTQTLDPFVFNNGIRLMMGLYIREGDRGVQVLRVSVY